MSVECISVDRLIYGEDVDVNWVRQIIGASDISLISILVVSLVQMFFISYRVGVK